MPKRIQKRRIGGSKSPLPYSGRNYQLFGLAILVLLVGYWALAQGPVDGFLSLTFAPILLVFAYCVLIPLAIIYGVPSKEKDQK